MTSLRLRDTGGRRLAHVAIFVAAVIARLMWLKVVPLSGDSLKYWSWAGAVMDGAGWQFNHAAHWTISYPIILCVLSGGQTLGLGATAAVQAAVQAALVFPLGKLLEMVGFGRGPVVAGMLAVAAAPYTAFAGSRALADPLATLSWWTGLALVVAALGGRTAGRRSLVCIAAGAACIGLAAHLRLNLIPAIGFSCAAVLAFAYWQDRRVVRVAALAVALFAACLPALDQARIARSNGAENYVETTTPLQVWSYTFYLGYDRWFALNSSPWQGLDPRPYLPDGWLDREDGPRANELIDESLHGGDSQRISEQLAELGREWRDAHPFAYYVGLPAERIVGAWVPLTPEVWTRFSANRVLHYGERLLTLLGLVAALRIAVRRRGTEPGAIALLVALTAFLQPTLTILMMLLVGAEFSDYRAHHAGWVAMLAVGAATVAAAVARYARRGSAAERAWTQRGLSRRVGPEGAAQ